MMKVVKSKGMQWLDAVVMSGYKHSTTVKSWIEASRSKRKHRTIRLGSSKHHFPFMDMAGSPYNLTKYLHQSWEGTGSPNDVVSFLLQSRPEIPTP